MANGGNARASRPPPTDIGIDSSPLPLRLSSRSESLFGACPSADVLHHSANWLCVVDKPPDLRIDGDALPTAISLTADKLAAIAKAQSHATATNHVANGQVEAERKGAGSGAAP